MRPEIEIARSVVKAARQLAHSGEAAELSAATSQLAGLRSVLTGALDQSQLGRVQAGLALVLSATIGLHEGDSGELSCQLARLSSSSADSSPSSVPDSRNRLIAAAAVQILKREGWEMHVTVSPQLVYLFRAGHRIQLERGGTPLSVHSEPGLHLDRAYTPAAEKSWGAALLKAAGRYDSGRLAVRERSSAIMPELVPLTYLRNLGEISAAELRSVCESNPRGALALVESYGPGFTRALLGLRG